MQELEDVFFAQRAFGPRHVVVQLELAFRHLHHQLLHRVLCYHPVDGHFLLLPMSVDPGLGLPVLLRVVIEVVQDGDVCRSQVDALPACTRRKQKDQDGVVFRVLVNQLLAFVDFGAAVNPQKLVPFALEPATQDVQRLQELREDEHTVPCFILCLEQRSQLPQFG